MHYLSSLISMVVAVVLFNQVSADTLIMLNGDQVSGEVIAMDNQQLQLKSSVFGVVKVPRDKVGAIYLGNFKLNPVKEKPIGSQSMSSNTRQLPNPLSRESVADAIRNSGVDPASLPQSPLNNNNQRGANSAKTGNQKSRVNGNNKIAPPTGVDNVLDQLRTQGVGSETRQQLQTMLPLMAMPGVGQYFDKTVGGLQNGTIDLSQVRGDAIRARSELARLKKELGPSGAALDGYLTILDKFIDETVNLKQNPNKNSNVPQRKNNP